MMNLHGPAIPAGHHLHGIAPTGIEKHNRRRNGCLGVVTPQSVNKVLDGFRRELAG
jgi:hypothetical protein